MILSASVSFGLMAQLTLGLRFSEPISDFRLRNRQDDAIELSDEHVGGDSDRISPDAEWPFDLGNENSLVILVDASCEHLANGLAVRAEDGKTDGRTIGLRWPLLQMLRHSWRRCQGDGQRNDRGRKTCHRIDLS